MKQYLGWKPAFVKYTVNLNQQAAENNLDPVVGRDKEINQVIDILSRRTKNNPLVIGDSGVGKTAVVEGLAQKLVKGEVPEHMKRKEILQLDYSALVAGARQKGEFEQRIKDLISAVSGNPNAILFVEDIHLLTAGNGGGVNAAEIFKKFLDHGQLPLIGVTTQKQYRESFEKNKSFERNFQLITIEEPGDDDAFAMLQAQRPKFEKFHAVIIPDEIVRQSVALTKKYIPQRFLPDKAIDVIDEAAADVKLQNETGKRGSNIVKKADIEKVISGWTGIKITKLTEDESKKLLMLEKLIHKKYVGQNHAVTKVSDAVRRGRIGLSSSKRPIASFLFHGGSGVGKTELVKVLSQVLFEKDDALLQLDMSEYMEKQDVSKLIGAPPGYVGYEEGGILTEAVNRRPVVVILMDNIEKIHPEIGNILLQILEEGSLTDNKGNAVSFKNTIIIGTTSLGKEVIEEKFTAIASEADEKEAERQLEAVQPVIKEQLLKFFAPEIVNRFDGIVSFKPLTQKDMEDISQLFISQTAASLRKQDFTLQIAKPAIEQLAKLGFSPKEGARPLRRIITDLIENPVTKAIIAQKFQPGGLILVESVNNGFVISNNAEQILSKANINLPRITDIAEYDTALPKKEQAKNHEIDNIYNLLKKLSKLQEITDQNERAKLEQINQQLMAEKEKGNPTADVILRAVQSFQAQPTVVPLPSVNGIQVVSEDEFDEVKAIWQENYLDLESTGNTTESQIDWLKKESEATQNMIKLFISPSPEDKDKAFREMVNILPVLLLGGFTEEEVLAYLRAKEEAAKNALETLTEEEDITISVHKAQQKTGEKHMATAT